MSFSLISSIFEDTDFQDGSRSLMDKLLMDSLLRTSATLMKKRLTHFAVEVEDQIASLATTFCGAYSI